MSSWPADHPAFADPALSPWRSEAEELCRGGTVIDVLRYSPGRRVVTLVRAPRQLVVLKLFASPRGRGNHRRLRVLAVTSAAPVLPTPIAASADGHSCTLAFQPGTPMPQLPDDQFVATAADAGDGLRRLHASEGTLDRTWTIRDELRQLARTAGTASRRTIGRVIARYETTSIDRLVPSHRDFYSAQVIRWRGAARLIDFDDAAMAPAALDVSNFVAHLDKDRVVGARPPSIVAAARQAFLTAYGDEPDDLWSWHQLSLARLLALAETRHRDPKAARSLAPLVVHAWP